MRNPLCTCCCAEDHFEVRPHHLAEFGEMCVPALAAKQLAAKLCFQRLDGSGKRGLRYLATLRCARKIQFLSHREEIADLLHFHDKSTVHHAGKPQTHHIAKPGKSSTSR